MARAAESHVFREPRAAAAPDLLNAEVLHVVRRKEREREIDAARSHEAIDDLKVLPIARYPTIALLDRAWRLRQNFTGYDAMYVALAEALETPLVTMDERLAAAARIHATIEVVLLK